MRLRVVSVSPSVCVRNHSLLTVVWGLSTCGPLVGREGIASGPPNDWLKKKIDDTALCDTDALKYALIMYVDYLAFEIFNWATIPKRFRTTAILYTTVICYLVVSGCMSIIITPYDSGLNKTYSEVDASRQRFNGALLLYHYPCFWKSRTLSILLLTMTNVSF